MSKSTRAIHNVKIKPSTEKKTTPGVEIMNSLLEGFKNIRISMAKTSKRLIPSSSSLKVAQGYESGPEGANLMRSTPTMMGPPTVIESKDDLVENKKEQTADNILKILRKMNDSIFKNSSIIEKSTS